MLLTDKTAIIYGGGGRIGGTVARAFAREGAFVHVTGRTAEPLEEVAADIRAADGACETAVVDALDAASVDAHADTVAAGGTIDISFNAISHGDVQGTPFVDMALEDFEAPVHAAVRTMFLTTRAAGRHMRDQGSGVILIFGGSGDPLPDWSLGGLQVAFEAQESMRRQLAAELGRYGVRTVTLQTGGILETIPADFEQADEVIDGIVSKTLLGRAATLEDVANTAVFAVSDLAKSLTATKINITCGAEVD